MYEQICHWLRGVGTVVLHSSCRTGHGGHLTARAYRIYRYEETLWVPLNGDRLKYVFPDPTNGDPYFSSVRIHEPEAAAPLARMFGRWMDNTAKCTSNYVINCMVSVLSSCILLAGQAMVAIRQHGRTAYMYTWKQIRCHEIKADRKQSAKYEHQGSIKVKQNNVGEYRQQQVRDGQQTHLAHNVLN